MQAEQKPSTRFRPAAPVPHTRNLSKLRFLVELGRNPVNAFGVGAYREPYAYARSRIQDFLLVNDPEGVKHVLLDNAANYVKSIQVRRSIGPALGNGLFSAEGESWRVQRRTAAPVFAPRRVAAFVAAMRDAAAQMLARWESQGEGAVIDAADEMMRLTYEIVTATMFSNDVAMNYAEMARALLIYINTLGRVDVLASLGLPGWVPTPRRVRGREALRVFRREVEGLVARRRAQLAADPAGVPDDFLTLLLTTRDPEGGALFAESDVFDNVMTFILAGHETTANTLAWTFYLLSQSADADTRVADEARAAPDGDPAATPYARMVLEESMRLYPPAPIISRDSVGPDVVGPIAIKANTSVMIAPWLLHRHTRLWDAPDYFDPERFAPGRRDQIHRFAYIPFGAGPRICIGMGFAMQEAMIILSAVARRFRLELVPGHVVEPLARLTLRPRYGLKMRVLRR